VRVSSGRASGRHIGYGSALLVASPRSGRTVGGDSATAVGWRRDPVPRLADVVTCTAWLGQTGGRASPCSSWLPRTSPGGRRPRSTPQPDPGTAAADRRWQGPRRTSGSRQSDRQALPRVTRGDGLPGVPRSRPLNADRQRLARGRRRHADLAQAALPVATIQRASLVAPHARRAVLRQIARNICGW
jgi:hypothetical protein